MMQKWADYLDWDPFPNRPPLAPTKQDTHRDMVSYPKAAKPWKHKDYRFASIAVSSIIAMK